MAGVITDASTLARPNALPSTAGETGQNGYQNRHRDLNEEHHPLPRSLPLSVVLPSGLSLSAVGKKFASVIPEISSSPRDGRSSARARASCLVPDSGEQRSSHVQADQRSASVVVCAAHVRAL